MDRLKATLKKDKKLLTVYFTAGFPELNSTLKILKELEDSGVDVVEIGIPFSDSLVDGPTIQDSNQIALNNGMTLKLLLEQLADVRKTIQVPIVLMGGLNPLLSYGMEKFIKEISQIGIDATIIPDLPIREFKEQYEKLFADNNISNIFLVSPQTSSEKIQMIDGISTSFIYAVSSYAITGNSLAESPEINEYFARIKGLNLKHPVMIGFGVRDIKTFEYASKNFAGAIVGTEFIKRLKNKETIRDIIKVLRD